MGYRWGQTGEIMLLVTNRRSSADLRENPILGPGAPSGPVSGPWSVVRGSRPLQTCDLPRAEAPLESYFAGREAHGSHGRGLTWRQHSVRGLLWSWVQSRGHRVERTYSCRGWPVFRTWAADRGSLRCRLRLGLECLTNCSRRYSSDTYALRRQDGSS